MTLSMFLFPLICFCETGSYKKKYEWMKFLHSHSITWKKECSTQKTTDHQIQMNKCINWWMCNQLSSPFSPSHLSWRTNVRLMFQEMKYEDFFKWRPQNAQWSKCVFWRIWSYHPLFEFGRIWMQGRISKGKCAYDVCVSLCLFSYCRVYGPVQSSNSEQCTTPQKFGR